MRKAALAFVTWAGMLFCGWLFVLRTTAPGLALDDGYIHLVYARNLLDGHPFQFNVGETSSGSTSPFWVLVLSVLGVFVGVMGASWVASALSFAIAAYAAFALARQVALSLEGDQLLPSLAPLVILTHGRFFWHAFSGMETQLYSAAVALSLAAFLSEARRGRAFFGSAAIGAVALWIRPETFLLVLVLASAYLLESRGRLRRALGPIAVLAASVALYFVFNYVLTGAPLPNTYFSKSSLYRGTRADYLGYTAATFWRDNHVLFIGFAFGFVLVLVRAFRSGVLWLSVPVVWVLGLVFAKFVVSPQEAHFGRYTVVVLPAAVGIAVGVFSLRRFVGLFALAAVLAANILDLPRWILMPARTVMQINVVHGDAARWLLEHAAQNATVATHDVGRIKYDTKMTIIDLAGLASNDIAKRVWERRRTLRHSFIAYDSIAAEVILSRRPDYIAISPVWFPYLSANRDALELLWRSFRFTDAVECVPEMAIYRLKAGGEGHLMDFAKHGFSPDKQWILGIFLPQVRGVLASLSTMPPQERALYLDFLRGRNERLFPYLRVSLRNIVSELIGWRRYGDVVDVAAFGCALYPDDPVLWNVMGAAFSQLGRFSDAAEAFRHALTLAPQNDTYRLNYAVALANSGNPSEALAQVDSVLARHPESARALFLRDFCERKMEAAGIEPASGGVSPHRLRE